MSINSFIGTQHIHFHIVMAGFELQGQSFTISWEVPIPFSLTELNLKIIWPILIFQ